MSNFSICCVLITLFFLASCKDGRNQKMSTTDSLKKSEHITPSTTVNFKLGQSLFISDCSACHVPKHGTDNLLLGIVHRLGVDYLKVYLTKQDSLINAKDKYATDLKKAYGNQPNSHNYQYSDNQLNYLVEYLK